MKPRWQPVLTHVILSACFLFLIGAGTQSQLVSPISRVGYAVILLGCALLLFHSHGTRLLAAPLDFGWIAWISLTGLTILLADNPRRALEPWLLPVAVQLPLAYGLLALLRRGASIRLVFRALFIAGAILFLMTLPTLLEYARDCVAAWQVGAEVRPFRLWTVLDSPVTFGIFIAITLPAAAGYLFTVQTRRERRLIILWIIAASALIIPHATRSATIATAAGISVACILGILAAPTEYAARIRIWLRTHRMMLGLGIVLTIVGVAAVLWIQGHSVGHDVTENRFDSYRIALRFLRQAPLTGWGPSGYIQAQLRDFSIPPRSLSPSVYNALLDVAASSGLAGILGILVFLTSAVLACIRAWLTQKASRPFLAGAFGGLIGFAVSGVLNNPFTQPGLTFTALTLLMVVIATLPVPRIAGRLRVWLVYAGVYCITLLSVALTALYIPYWVVTHETHAGIVDLGGNNTDPLVVLQSAYSFANSANLQLPDTLATAIDRFERAVAVDPEYSVHWVNLSTLYARANRTEDAIQTALIATQKAPRNAVAWLNLGIQFEHTRHEESAARAYRNALAMEPRWLRSSFWQATDHPGRRDAYEDSRAYAASLPSTFESDLWNHVYTLYHVQNASEYLIMRGAQALQDKAYSKAEAYFREAVNIEQNRFERVYAVLGLATAQQAQGKAIVDNTVQLLSNTGVYGPGSAGDFSYAQITFWRSGQVSDYLPDVTILDRTLNFDLFAGNP